MRESGRIPGSFAISWEQRKVSDLSEKTFGGGTPKTSNDSFWKGNIPWIQSSDLVEGSLFDVEPRKYISQEAVDKSATKLVPEKSVAIVTRVGVGKLAFMPFSYATSQDFLSLSVLKTEPQFTVYALYKKLQSELNAVQGTSIKGVTKDELLAKEVMIPCYKEQEKIGSYLHFLDHLITLHQRKLCVLCILERLLYENIKQFEVTVSWEQRKFGEVLETVTDYVAAGSFADLAKNVEYKDYPDYAQLIRTKDLKNGFTSTQEVYVNKNAFDYLYRVNMDKECIILPNIGNCGEVYYVKPESLPYEHNVLGPNAIFVRSETCANNFLSILFQAKDFQTKLKLIVSPNGQTKFNKTELKGIDLILPRDVYEQEKIGQYFSNLDRLITLHQRKP